MSTRSISFNLGNTGSPVLDSSFPRVAAKAALEVDGVLLRLTGKQAPKEFAPVAVTALLPLLRRFAESLTAVQGVAPGEGGITSSRLDPASQRVFMLAYENANRFSHQQNEPSLKELGQATGRVVKVLEDVANKSKPGHVLVEKADAVAFARDFCRALSNQSAERQFPPHIVPHQGLRRR